MENVKEQSGRRQRAGFSEPAPRADRLPPHSPEGEAGVLGCILLAPRDCIGECVEVLPEGGRVFYDLRHELIYQTVVEMWDANEAIDMITLQERLKVKQRLEEVGGLAYLTALPDTVPSAANLRYYLDIIKEKFLQRSMLATLVEGERKIWDWQGPTEELLDTIEADVLRVNVGTGKEMPGMKVLVAESINRMEEMHRGVGLLGGVRSHFGYYDKMTGGLHRGEMIVLAARPSVGKTSLLMNMVWNVAVLEGLPVGVFSMEMSAADLTMRLICAAAEVDFHKIRTGFIAEADFPKLTSAAARVQRAPIFIDDTRAQSILQVRAKARRMKQRHGIKMVGIDYLQLMHSTNRRANNREQEIADISGGIKGLAGELDVPAVVLSQLNRESAKNKNRKPQLEDLRESGAIEQDADLVGLLYRPKSDTDDDEENTPEFQVNVLVAKQRNGPTGNVELMFKRWCMKFVDKYGNRGKETAPETNKGKLVALPTSQELGFNHRGAEAQSSEGKTQP